MASADRVNIKVMQSDKYLISKFNKKFDQARDLLNPNQGTPEK